MRARAWNGLRKVYSDFMRAVRKKREKEGEKSHSQKERRRGRPREDGLILTPEEERRARELKERADAVKDSRYTLLKSKDSLSPAQAAKLKWATETDPGVALTHGFKESICEIVKLSDPEDMKARLLTLRDGMRESGIAEAERLATTIDERLDAILNSCENGLNNARVERMNGEIKKTISQACGFRSFDNMVALLMLRYGGRKVNYPRRLFPRKAAEETIEKGAVLTHS